MMWLSFLHCTLDLAVFYSTVCSNSSVGLYIGVIKQEDTIPNIAALCISVAKKSDPLMASNNSTVSSAEEASLQRVSRLTRLQIASVAFFEQLERRHIAAYCSHNDHLPPCSVGTKTGAHVC